MRVFYVNDQVFILLFGNNFNGGTHTWCRRFIQQGFEMCTHIKTQHVVYPHLAATTSEINKQNF